MRISEMKQCFPDPKIRACISKDCWEMPLFRSAMNRYHGEADAERIYQVIRKAFLCRYPSPLEEYEDRIEMGKSKRILKTLSGRMYGDSLHWVEGTAWEGEIEKRTARLAEQQLCREKAAVLYERLDLEPGVPRDIIAYAVKNPAIRQRIDELEEAGTPVMTREDLYSCMETVLIPQIQDKGISYIRFCTLSAISALAYGERSYWAERNGLDFSQLETTVFTPKAG